MSCFLVQPCKSAMCTYVVCVCPHVLYCYTVLQFFIRDILGMAGGIVFAFAAGNCRESLKPYVEPNDRAMFLKHTCLQFIAVSVYTYPMNAQLAPVLCFSMATQQVMMT